MYGLEVFRAMRTSVLGLGKVMIVKREEESGCACANLELCTKFELGPDFLA